MEGQVAEEAVGLDTWKLTRFVELHRVKREMEAALRKVEDEIAVLEPILREQFAVAGIQSMSVNGMTAYVSRQVFPKYKDGAGRGDVIEALKADGLGDILREDYNSQTFNSLIRDIESSGRGLPEHLARVIEISEKYELRTRRA